MTIEKMLKEFPNLPRALDFATRAHFGQKRKYDERDYIVHPIEVSEILYDVGIRNEAMLIAALNHDVVEDTEATLDDIERVFGYAVAVLVEGLTDVSTPSDGNRAVRKAKDLKHTASRSPEVKTVKLADLISNTKSIVEHDLKFAKVFLTEKALLMTVLHEGDSKLYAIANELLHDGLRKVNA